MFKIKKNCHNLSTVKIFLSFSRLFSKLYSLKYSQTMTIKFFMSNTSTEADSIKSQKIKN